MNLRKKIIKFIRNNPSVTSKELMNEVNLSEPGVKKNLKQLKDMGLIKRIGANKNGYWKV